MFTALLVVAGFGLVLLGAIFLTSATAGVGLIAAACFVGIVARIIQAQGHANRLHPPD